MTPKEELWFIINKLSIKPDRVAKALDADYLLYTEDVLEALRDNARNYIDSLKNEVDVCNRDGYKISKETIKLVNNLTSLHKEAVKILDSGSKKKAREFELERLADQLGYTLRRKNKKK